ncbi:hypothetical protein [Methylomonas rosea]|uniref:PEP-CTERM sorting domain-containing protein n=1 Tax=Methylomonas rosea TaxID=2952227 RepID=A0ABT1TTI4_9GAMM|nr:hypothetical protein [Methylomonas sp. WSC-7]MCQ8118074.1 hypothetical protein [Methylomonas sp. WSC-7]
MQTNKLQKPQKQFFLDQNISRFNKFIPLAAISLLAFASHASASVVYSANSNTQVRKVQNGTFIIAEQHEDPKSTNDGSAVTTSSSSSQGRSSANITNGTIKVFAEAANAGPQNQPASANGNASIKDNITIHSLQLIDGSQGIARGHIYIDLPLSGTTAAATSHVGNADASANAALSLLGPNGSVTLFNYTEQSSLFANFTDVYTNTSLAGAKGHYTVDIPIILGQAFTLEMRAVASVTARAVNSSGVADLANSFYWGGLESITVGNLNITDFNALGSSRVDWKASYAPVPLPTSALFLLTGLVGLTRIVIRKP